MSNRKNKYLVAKKSTPHQYSTTNNYAYYHIFFKNTNKIFKKFSQVIGRKIYFTQNLLIVGY